MSTIHEIYETVAASCAAAQLASCWNDYPCHPAFIELPNSVELEAAVKQFPIDALVAAGVTTADGQLVAALRDDDSPCSNRMAIALRRQPEEPPFALIGGTQLLSGSVLPAVAMLEDYRLQHLLEDADGLLLASNLADVAALWSVGLPAVPLTGLANLGGRDLEFLSSQLRWEAPAVPPDEEAAFQQTQTDPARGVVLVDWRPFLLNVCDDPQIDAVAKHLHQLEVILDFDLDQSGRWRPSQDDFERLRFAAQFSPKNIPVIILESLLNIRVPLVKPADPVKPTPAPRYHELLTRWLDHGDVSQADAVAVWNQLLERLEHELIIPLLNQADQVTDAVRKNALMRLATLYREYHTRNALRQRELRRQAPGAACIHPAEDKQLTALEKRIADLSNWLQTPATPENARRRQDSQPSLPLVTGLPFAKSRSKPTGNPNAAT